MRVEANVKFRDGGSGELGTCQWRKKDKDEEDEDEVGGKGEGGVRTRRVALIIHIRTMT